MATRLSLCPAFLRRRSVRYLCVLTALAVPLALLPAGSGMAAPTITVGQAQAQLAALQAREDAAVEAFNAGRIAADSAARAASAAQAEVGAEQARLAGMRRRLSAFAAAAYTSGGLDGLTGLLAGNSAASVINRAANLNEIARSRDAQMVAMTAERTRLQGLQQTANDRAAAATQRERQLAAAQRSVQALLSQQQAVLGRLRADQRRALLALQAQQQAAASRSASRLSLTSHALPAGSGIAQTVLTAAYSQRGKPYHYGAAGPDAYDCSGLVMWAFAHAGISLPHSAAGQYGYGTHVPPSQLQPGDIVFFDEGGSIGHDGIYVGNGEMIDANHSGGWVDVRPLYSGLIGGTRL